MYTTSIGGIVPFTGLACSWQINTNGWRVSPGAFRRTIQAAEADRTKRDTSTLWPMLLDHRPDRAFAWIASAEETEEGLLVNGFMDETTSECRKVMQDIRNGKEYGLSIGYRVIRQHLEGPIRVLDEVEVYEISTGLDPVDRLARLKIRDWSDVEYACMRAVNQEMEFKMGYDYDERFGGYSDRSEQLPVPEGFESRAAFERDLRSCRREDDPILGRLDPNGKEYRKEVERRLREREEKQRLQREALEQERREAAARQAAQSASSFTVASFAAAFGLDENFVRQRFQGWVSAGLVTPINADTLTLNGDDARRQARREWERFESRSQEVAFRKAQEER